MRSLLACLFVLTATTVLACSSSSSNDSKSSGPSTGQTATVGGALTTEDRCTHFCGADGTDLCRPDFYGKITSASGGNEHELDCEALCTKIAPVAATDPGAGGADACAVEMGKYLECAYPCKTDQDMLDAKCFRFSCQASAPPEGPVAVVSLGACDRTAVESACKTKLADYAPPSANGPKNAGSECNKLCQKQAAKSCEPDNCALGCSIYVQYPQACQDAEVTLADCQLGAADICKSMAGCTTEYNAWVKACHG